MKLLGSRFAFHDMEQHSTFQRLLQQSNGPDALKPYVCVTTQEERCFLDKVARDYAAAHEGTPLGLLEQAATMTTWRAQVYTQTVKRWLELYGDTELEVWE